MEIKDLKNISIIGLGLLGGSLGMAASRTMPAVKRRGYSHRLVTRQKALKVGAVDVACESIAEAVSGAQLVVLASPIGTFEEIMREMAPHLPAGCIVTDVGSTKVVPERLARQYLPKTSPFLGSHPMAGSEQRGVEFARADLFDNACCILTPTAGTKTETVEFLSQFWQALGMRIYKMSPAQHDRVLARISHLPHVLAMSLVNCTEPAEMLFCGKGFLDTTRIASGPPGVWRDILMTNPVNTAAAIDRLIKQLTQTRKALQGGDEKKLVAMLTQAQARRNELVEKMMRRKELPG